MKVIIFQLNEQAYGVDIQQVRSIERMQTITEVPNTPEFIKGVMNLREETTPIIDLKKCFSMTDTRETRYTDETRILLVYLDNMQIGLIVDAATNVLDLDIATIESAPSIIGGVHDAYLRGVAKLENELLILLDLERVLNLDEKNELLKTVEE